MCCRSSLKLIHQENLINMVYRLVLNNWYSILLNEQPQSLFKSTSGLKKGDPLSLTLFIIVAEVLSRVLNSLLNKKEFKGFGMPRGSPKVNHLSFANDMIILCKADVRIMQMVANVLEKYKRTSG